MALSSRRTIARRLEQILQDADNRLQALGDSESRWLNDKAIAVAIDDEAA